MPGHATAAASASAALETRRLAAKGPTLMGASSARLVTAALGSERLEPFFLVVLHELLDDLVELSREDLVELVHGERRLGPVVRGAALREGVGADAFVA